MRKIFYGLGIIVMLVAGYIAFRVSPVPVEAVVVSRGPFDETLTAEGKVRSRTRRVVYAFGSGNLSDFSLKVGDQVKKGQKVSTLMWDWDLTVKSPIDGVISKIYRESAGPIARGEPIFEVSDVSDLEVVVELLTPDAVRVNPNIQAKIMNWGGDHELGARVKQISRAGAVKTSALGVEEERTEVKLAFDQIPKALKSKFGDNYHVDVIFQLGHVEDALTVPLGALFKNGDKWAVYLIEGGRARLREITITKRNDHVAIVGAGLNVGDRVILFPGDKIKDGSLVKILSKTAP